MQKHLFLKGSCRSAEWVAFKLFLEKKNNLYLFFLHKVKTKKNSRKSSEWVASNYSGEKKIRYLWVELIKNLHKTNVHQNLHLFFVVHVEIQPSLVSLYLVSEFSSISWGGRRRGLIPKLVKAPKKSLFFSTYPPLSSDHILFWMSECMCVCRRGGIQ